LLFEARGIATASAGTAVTLYWGGLFASRLGYAFLPTNVNPESVVKLCMITALAGVVILLLNLHPIVDTVAIALMGFAAGPIFPSLIATTPARVGPRHTANTVGLQVSMGAVGLAALPALCGLIAQYWGLELIPIVLTAGWAILLAAYLALRRVQLATVL
jgi:fucose permease